MIRPSLGGARIEPAHVMLNASKAIMVQLYKHGSCASTKPQPMEYWSDMYYILTAKPENTAEAQIIISAANSDTYVNMVTGNSITDRSRPQFTWAGSNYNRGTQLLGPLANGVSNTRVLSTRDDLSGVYIQSQGGRLINVLAGTTSSTYQGTFNADTTYDAMVPANSWGNQFWVPHMPRVSNGYTLKFMTNTNGQINFSHDNTKTKVLTPGRADTLAVTQNVPTQISSSVNMMAILVRSNYV